MNIRVFCLAIILIIASLSAAGAEGYVYDEDTTVVGTIGTYTVAHTNESLIELARKFDLGYNEITGANPDLDPFVPGEGKSVLIPSSWILPDVKVYNGIVINLSELRLYYFFKRDGKTYVQPFPIGIGSEGTDTPLGSFTIMEKIVHPAWNVPASIRKEKPELPPVVPPGPDNPMGSHALRLSLPSVLIHGTNRPFAIGRKASHGCIRLYPEDIPQLFSMVPKGTPVSIVRQPVKIGVKEGKVYIEVHKDKTTNPEACFKIAIDLLVKRHLLGLVSSVKLFQALGNKTGFPVKISEDSAEGRPPAGVSGHKQPLRENLEYNDSFLLL
ncbi:MAG: L,D-transpeptidase family protein [Dissulfurispiraceae bacterium]|jgi:L,D-transpeptidase ErfK/SrfK